MDVNDDIAARTVAVGGGMSVILRDTTLPMNIDEEAQDEEAQDEGTSQPATQR